jgi:hypothetical protein
MTSYPLCTDKTVKVRSFPSGMRETSGVCYGDLAVIRIMNSPDYTILHVPSGFTFKTAGCCFRYQHTAVDAMMEMARLRNRWSFDDINGLQKLQGVISEIGTKHGGYSAARGPEVLDYREDVNGKLED